MKTKAFLLFVTLSFGYLPNCNKPENNFKLTDFTTIGQENLYGNGSEKIGQENLIISDTGSWNELITKMNTVNNVSDGFTEIDIDFMNFMIIAIFDKVYGNGGHSIDINKIEETESKVIVTTDNILKGDITCIMTQPFHIVRIEKTDKLIFFE